ncbi:condensation domain-containing protein [Kitasatospora sp. NPDC006697]|uniref:condensation domain-containing protein n=1 Tax=Kitasatospora sp. NPDC006697 TaxID=3364020 RepID=UPI0036CA0265
MGTPQQGIPLSVGQEAMWLAWELEPEQLTHIIPLPFLVAGELDPARLRQAVAAVGEAYPQLRARVVRTAGRPVLSWEQAPEIPVVERTVTAEPAQAVRETWQVPFDLGAGPLARVHLLRGPDYTLLLFAVHHLVFDGASVLLMLDAFRRAYDGEQPRPAQRPEALTAFAHRSRELADTAAGDALRAYWKGALGETVPEPALPANQDAQPRYTMLSADVPSDLADGLRSRAEELGCSYFTVLLAAYFVLLRRHSGTEDLMVSIPFHGRTDPQVREEIGYFVNPLPVRLRLRDTDLYTDLVAALRSAVKERLRHGELPLAAIMRAGGFTGPQARARTHQSLFQYWHAGRHQEVDVQNLALRWGGARCVLSLLDMESTANYRLAVMVREDSGGTHVLWKDPAGAVGPTSVAELAEDYLAVLKSLAAAPQSPIAPVLKQSAGPDSAPPAPEPQQHPVDHPEETAAMAAVWEEVLGIDGITARDSFFELGGHSLLAETLTTLAGERFGLDIPVRDLFSYPRLQDFVRHVLGYRTPPAPAAATGPVTATVPEYGDELPAGAFQQRIWLIEQDDDSARPNVCLGWTTPGGLDAGSLAEALAMLVASQEILRTRFRWRDGALVQQIAEPWRPVVEELDLRGAADPDAGLDAWLSAAALRRFAPESGRLLRVALAELGGGRQALLVCVHHLAIDGESVPVLLAELERCHAAVRAGTTAAPAAVQYRDFTAAEQAEQADGRWAEDLRYWADTLAGAPVYLDVSTTATPEEEGAVTVRAGRGLLGRLQPVQAEYGVSWFIIAATALAVALHRWSGSHDLTFEVPVANRGRGRGPLADVLGPCLNTVILRSTIAPDAVVADVLHRMRSTSLDAFEHCRAPYDRVLAHLDPPRRLPRTPYADIILNMNSRTNRRARLAGAELTPLYSDALASHDKQFGLTVTLTEQDGDLTITLAHRGRLLSRAEARTLADDLGTLLADFADNLRQPVLPARSGW